MLSMMDRDLFRSLLHDALINIHDYVVLEKHPLNEIIPRSDPAARRAENLRQFIWDGIESLKPKTQPVQIDSPEWRYYLILSGRYIEGASVAEIQKRLSLGERQERRLHGRAFSALDEVLWDRVFPSSETGKHSPAGGWMASDEGGLTQVVDKDQEEELSFPVTLEPLHLDKLIEETTALFLPRLQSHGSDLSIQVPADLPMVQADRIILRQILLHLFNRILQRWAGDEVSISASPKNRTVIVEIVAFCEQEPVHSQEELLSNKLLAYWLDRLSAQLTVESLEESASSALEINPSPTIRYVLELPQANQAKILVVDDHEPAIRIIQLYLRSTNFQAVGVSDPTQILAMARTLRPKAILLDVMMPAMDGWEILQKLKSNPETNPIPVIICSVWEQPDLAFSLGANGFLKKPINQAELLDELARSHLLDTWDESLREGS